MKSIIKTAAFLMMTVSLLADTQVIPVPDANQALQNKIKWAEQTLQKTNFDTDCWIGYSIRKQMRKNSRTGSFCHDGRDRQTLREILTGVETLHQDVTNETLIETARHALNKDPDNPLVMKEVAFLFRIPAHAHQLNAAKDIKMTNVDLYADLDNLPIVWLGEVKQSESLDLLISAYPDMHEDEQESIIVAVSMHDEKDRVIAFLTDRINSRESESLREDAVFWLGQQDNKRALPLLKKTVEKDRSVEVREKAVFSISTMDLEEAEDLLIDLAYHAEPQSIREKAVFWLGQKASEKATETLKDVVFNAEESDVQEHAVFALSQQDNDIAVPALINIAKTHPNPKVRKKAIFWLGETGDPRGVDLLVELVKQ